MSAETDPEFQFMATAWAMLKAMEPEQMIRCLVWLTDRARSEIKARRNETIAEPEKCIADRGEGEP